MIRIRNLLFAGTAAVLAACASTSPDLAGPTADPHAAECAALRSQDVEMNKTAVLPQYCKDLESLRWSSQAKDPIKINVGKDNKGNE